MCGDVDGCGLHTPVWTAALHWLHLWGDDVGDGFGGCRVSGRIVWCGESHGGMALGMGCVWEWNGCCGGMWLGCGWIGCGVMWSGEIGVWGVGLVCRWLQNNSLSETVPAQLGSLGLLQTLCGCGVCDVDQNVCVICVWRVQCALHKFCRD